MKLIPLRQEGYQLMHEGARALAVVEANGIRIDVGHLDATQANLQEQIRQMRAEIERGLLWKAWRKRFGDRANLTSKEQLGVMLFEELGFKPRAYTETGRPSTDEEALQDIEHPAVVKLLRLSKYEKANGTYLKGLRDELVGDRIHPVFNLHTVRTYRSSCDSPNFQNMPVRDKEIAEIIRTQIIPSKGCVLTENDFKGIEVSVSACYHHDANFISYITTPGKDMHRDMAAQIYCLKPKQVSKDARYGAKNKFVFPQFYGDYYVACAKSMWDWATKGKLKGPGGEPLLEHLQECGITKLGKCDPEQDPRPGTFELHMKEVENDFWNKRFMQYGQWRKDWFKAYLKKGYFDLLSGFRVFGVFGRNAVTNYPVQGSAFHCLLWSLIQINRRLRKHQMRSKVVGQIHDSLIGDVRLEELRDYLEIVEQVTTVELRRHYRWLIVPMVVEYEISPPRGSWYAKQEVQFARGRFGFSDAPEWHTKDPVVFAEELKRRSTKTKKT